MNSFETQGNTNVTYDVIHLTFSIDNVGVFLLNQEAPWRIILMQPHIHVSIMLTVTSIFISIGVGAITAVCTFRPIIVTCVTVVNCG